MFSRVSVQRWRCIQEQRDMERGGLCHLSLCEWQEEMSGRDVCQDVSESKDCFRKMLPYM